MGALGVPGVRTAAVTVSTPTSASAPSGTVSWSASSVPPGGGSFSASSCTLGGASTDPDTGAVSSSCSVTYTPTVVGAHTITASYSGDASRPRSWGTLVVTVLKQQTKKEDVCSPGL